MGELNLEIWDATGNKKLQAAVPDDVTVDRILIVLVEKLKLPRYNTAGEFMSYKLHHRRLGIQLLDDATLKDQQVEDNDVLRILSEITAGGIT
jgi:uncharacterized ubiquitin-like protein YukD